MNEPNRQRKGEIKYNISLNDEQKEAKRLIIENQIVVITGRAGCGKSLVSAQVGLDFLFKKQIQTLSVTRATVELGSSLGFLPGTLQEKLNPYLEAFIENLQRCHDKDSIRKFLEEERIVGFPVQFVRGKTIDDVLVVEEAQNLTKHQMLGILTRLGKNGKIIINGDREQRDITATGEQNGLDYVIELANRLNEIKHIKLKENHRSDLVGKILELEYKNKT